jgi:leucyl aminopeptidase
MYGMLVENELGAHKFEAKAGQTLVLPKKSGGGYLIGVGVGKMETTRELREAFGMLLAKLQGLSGTVVDVTVHEQWATKFGAATVAGIFEETANLFSYQFARYKEVPKAKIASITVYLEVDQMTGVKGAVEAARARAEGVKLTRNLVNTSANDMTPTVLANEAKAIAKKSSLITANIHDAAWAKKQGMGAYLAVDQGSDEPAKFIHLVYKPKKAKKKVAIVGKGVTFDSGGLSLKPANYMETMKCDMAGAAVVLGVFEALTHLEFPVEVHGYIAATENMPSGKAIRPGDVVRSAHGKTIEILNTDAEGRLTLADALWYAQKQKPDHIVDLATLTGACVVALGEQVAGVMSDDSELTSALKAAADASSEDLWQLPLHSGYTKSLKSDIADLKNITSSPYGGAVTAGLFLKEFINEGQSWAHMDIAGPAFVSAPLNSYIGKGGTGYGVRTLLGWIESL